LPLDGGILAARESRRSSRRGDLVKRKFSSQSTPSVNVSSEQTYEDGGESRRGVSKNNESLGEHFGKITRVLVKRVCGGC